MCFSNKISVTVCLLTVLLFSSCDHEKEVKEKIIEVKKVIDVNAAVNDELKSIFDKQLNDSTLILVKDTLKTLAYIKPLFEIASPFWTNKGVYNTTADTLFTIITDARYYGLIPNDYHFERLQQLKEKILNVKDSIYDAFALAETEVLLSDAYFTFGAHLNKGRFSPDTLMLEWKPQKLDTNWLNMLKDGLNTGNIRAAFDSLEPKHEGYTFLKYALKNYIIENENINWDSIPFYSTTDSVLRLKLKERLFITGDYDTNATGNDSVKIAKALKSFQKKMNLDPDGKLGKFTKQALGSSKEYIIRQMEMALERWRWEPNSYPNKYFWVNIPSADMYIYEYDKKQKRDTVVLYSKVVVGKPTTPTPLIKSKINFITIYPYWSVPYSIATKEILPAVQRDTGYLSRKNFEVVDWRGNILDPSKLNWKKYNKNYLPFKFRQRIGGDNSLGICKFNFYNKDGIYLHDTNSKKYFKTFYRFQSHGCIRLEKYVETAKFLIREDTLRLPYDTLMSYFITPIQRQVNLRKPIQIYVKYYSVLADSSGLHWYLDIYRKDEKMMNMVYKGK